MGMGMTNRSRIIIKDVCSIIHLCIHMTMSNIHFNDTMDFSDKNVFLYILSFSCAGFRKLYKTNMFGD